MLPERHHSLRKDRLIRLMFQWAQSMVVLLHGSSIMAEGVEGDRCSGPGLQETKQGNSSREEGARVQGQMLRSQLHESLRHPEVSCDLLWGSHASPVDTVKWQPLYQAGSTVRAEIILTCLQVPVTVHRCLSGDVCIMMHGFTFP